MTSHHKAIRADGHLFITVTAYQLEQVIRRAPSTWSWVNNFCWDRWPFVGGVTRVGGSAVTPARY